MEAFGLSIVEHIASEKEEKKLTEKWHKQRDEDEAEARSRARKAPDYELPDHYERPGKMPYPVPKGWNWREALKAENESKAQKSDEDRWEDRGRDERGYERRDRSEHSTKHRRGHDGERNGGHDRRRESDHESDHERGHERGHERESDEEGEGSVITEESK